MVIAAEMARILMPEKQTPVSEEVV